MSTGYEPSGVFKGKTTPPTAGQGDMFVDQTSNELYVHNGQRFNLLAPIDRNVRSFGARGDGVTNDTAAFQTAIDAAIASGGGVYVPPGNYYIYSTLNVQNVSGFSFRGGGTNRASTGGDAHGARLTWRGDANSPLLKLDDVGCSLFENFSIVASPSLQLFAGIQSVNGSGSSVTNTLNKFSNIRMNGTSTGIDYGFLFGGTGTTDGNNDVHRLINCSVDNFGTAAFALWNSQVKNIIFYGCTYQANALGGQYGVYVDPEGGSFLWYGGFGSGVGHSNFYIGAPSDACLISGGNFESSPRLLYVDGPTSAAFPITIEGVRWAHAGYIASDKFYVNCLCPGPLTMRGCHIQDSNAAPASAWNALKIQISTSNTTGATPTLTIENNEIQTTATTLYTLAGTGFGAVHAVNNNYFDRQNTIHGQFPTEINASTSFPGQLTTTPGTAGPDWNIKASGGGRTSIATTGTGGAGSALTLTGGPGATAPSAATASTGGAGGALSLTAGAGAVASGAANVGTNVGGAGGQATLAAGAGGATALGSTNTGGAGGDVVVAAGAGGSGATATGAHGVLYLKARGASGDIVHAINAMDTMTYSATISLSVYAASLHYTTTVHATGNATINASAAGYKGQRMTVMIENDATSGKVITFGTNFRSNGTLTGTTSKVACVEFVSNGTSWFETNRQTGL